MASPRAYSSARPAASARRLGQHALDQLLGGVAQPAVAARADQARQVGAHGADRRGDRHVVVVQHHDQPLARRPGVVHGLVGHAGAHRAVADHAHHVAPLALQARRRRHAEPGRDRGRGVGGAERVVGALRPAGEAGEPAGLAQGADAGAAAGQDLVRVGLVADVPDQPVPGRVEHVVQRHRELDHAQPGAEVPARGRDRVHHLPPQLVRHPPQRLPRQPPQRGGVDGLVEVGRSGHGCFLNPRVEASRPGNGRPQA